MTPNSSLLPSYNEACQARLNINSTPENDKNKLTICPHIPSPPGLPEARRLLAEFNVSEIVDILPKMQPITLTHGVIMEVYSELDELRQSDNPHEFQNKVANTLEFLNYIPPFSKPELTNNIKYAMPFYLLTQLQGLTLNLTAIERQLFASPNETLSDNIRRIVENGNTLAPCYTSGCNAAQSMFLLNLANVMATPESEQPAIYIMDANRKKYACHTFAPEQKSKLIPALANLCRFCSLLSAGEPDSIKSKLSMTPQACMDLIFSSMDFKIEEASDFLNHTQRMMTSNN